MKNRFGLVFSTLAAAALALTACGTPTPTPTAVPPTEPAAEATATTETMGTGAPLVGEVTLWHAYGTGSTEEKALTQVIDSIKANNPDLTINALQIPFDQVFNKWETEVAAGEGPDIFTAPNDNLGNQVRAELVAGLSDKLEGHLDMFAPLAVEGVTVDGEIYAVPGIVKAVALYYNADTVDAVPTTTDELLAAVKDGKKLVINQNGYHNFGFFGAFGGQLMDDNGACIADQGGFAEAFQYLLDLKAAGAIFETDGGKADTLFKSGDADMIINGPWVLGDYQKEVKNLGVAPIPAGPDGNAATPLTGIDGWYVNPNGDDAQQQLATDLALWVLSPENQAIYADVAGAPPSAVGVKTANPLVTAFAEAGAAGFPRPQSAEFGNYWGPFGDALTKVMEGKSSPEDAVTEACAAMNTANGVEANGDTGGEAMALPALSGEVTLWHAYGTGSTEEKALSEVIANIEGANPDVTINVLQIPFDQIFNKWETEVAAGEGPDIFTAPNDNLGNQVRAELVAGLSDKLEGHLDMFAPLAVEGVTVDGEIYAVPGIVKAVALYYNADTVDAVPTTTDELLAAVKDGKKLVINQNGYHNFGFFGAFGGQLMDDNGACIADQGGFAEAFQYLLDLKAAGAIFETDGGKADTLFKSGDADMIINGPWVLGDYQKEVKNLGVAPIPAGPDGNAATPLTGIDGWYVNPNGDDAQQQLATDLALWVLSPENQAIYADVAGAPPSAVGVKTANPLVTAFAEAGAAGFPRPQSAEFGNYWGPFGDALTKVMEGKSSPEDAVTEACSAMNTANGK